jgi:drug/metabolite transporter (DMT)-like permease
MANALQRSSRIVSENVLGILLALASALTWGSGDFLSGLMSRRQPLLVVLLVSQAAGVPLMGTLALAFRGVPADWSFIPLAGLAGLTGLIGLAALFRGLALGTMSIVAPISATGAALPVIVGLFTGEQPSPVQGVGVLFALAGVALASRPAPDPPASEAVPHPATSPDPIPSFVTDPGQLAASDSPPLAARPAALAAGAGFGLLAALGFGLFYVVLRAASVASGEDPFWPVFIARTVSATFLVVVCLVARPRLQLRAPDIGTLILAGALDVGANAFYAAASTSGIGPLAAVLSSLFPVTTIVLARLFLAERVAPTQGAGIVSALIGVALIAWK